MIMITIIIIIIIIIICIASVFIVRKIFCALTQLIRLHVSANYKTWSGYTYLKLIHSTCNILSTVFKTEFNLLRKGAIFK
jgi:hypothetical protein